jgi:hypothetical protein
MLFAYVERGMLQNALDEANLVGRVGSDERRCCPAEVMQAHGFAELGRSTGPGNVIEPGCR